MLNRNNALARRVAAALRRRGNRVLLRTRDGEERRVWACVVPYMHRNRQYLEERLTVLGAGEPNSYLYLGEADGPARPGDFVEEGRTRYVFSTCTAVNYRGEAAYVWGVLKQTEGEGAKWTM